MINKRDIINFLFIASFPVYGIGSYVAGSISPGIGYLIALSPYAFIILFYSIDLLYKKEFYFRLNFVYFLMLAFQLSGIVSLFIALANGLPEANLPFTIIRSVVLLAPFHAFIVVALYNDDHKDKLPRLTLISLSLLMAVNLIAYFGLGMSNAIHSIEGRLSLPFFDGFYSGANVLAIIDLILLYYLYKSRKDPVRFTALAAYFTFNLVLFYLINSRLSTLILILILGLIVFRLISSRTVYFLSLFTIPILLSSSILLYKILQHPLFVSLMQRVDLEDVTTFNGRAFLWRDALDWLFYDQRGLLFGNGYKGHYFLDLIPDVVKLWNAEESQHLHLHSTSLETLVCQGVVFYFLLCVLFYIVYSYYRQKYMEGSEEGAFFSMVVFILFIMQVDTFVYLDSFGFVLFALVSSKAVIREPFKEPADAAGQGLTESGCADALTVHSVYYEKDQHVNGERK